MQVGFFLVQFLQSIIQNSNRKRAIYVKHNISGLLVSLITQFANLLPLPIKNKKP